MQFDNGVYREIQYVFEACTTIAVVYQELFPVQSLLRHHPNLIVKVERAASGPRLAEHIKKCVYFDDVKYICNVPNCYELKICMGTTRERSGEEF